MGIIGTAGSEVHQLAVALGAQTLKGVLSAPSSRCLVDVRS
jgi:hypothetical protein